MRDPIYSPSAVRALRAVHAAAAASGDPMRWPTTAGVVRAGGWRTPGAARAALAKATRAGWIAREGGCWYIGAAGAAVLRALGGVA